MRQAKDFYRVVPGGRSSPTAPAAAEYVPVSGTNHPGPATRFPFRSLQPSSISAGCPAPTDRIRSI